MRQYVISLVICSMLLLCTFPTMVQVTSSKQIPDWPDGTFQGTWKNQQDNTSGSFWGELNQGRRATRGTLSGTWNTSDGVTTGQVQGVFFGKLFIGQWSVTDTGETSRCIGTITYNETHFSGRLRSRTAGVIEISGAQDASFLPKLTSTYGIGVKQLYLIDPSRPEYFTNDSSDVREMMAQLWYPIEPNQTGNRADYMDYPTFQWLKNRSPIPLVTIPNNAYLFVRPHGRNQTSIAPGLFPVIVFSPGYDGVYQIYTSFIEDVVSHGFVVISLNHPYVSGITVFPDGRTIGLATVPTGPVERSAFFNMSLRTIVGDATFALDTITEMNQSDADFSGHFDLSRVGMYGHSFGGANTAVCCYEDPRFDAGLTLDGVFYKNFIPGNISASFLMMFAESRLSNDSTIEYMWNHMTADTYKIVIAGSTHYAFTDVGVLLSHLVPIIPPRLLMFGTIAPKRMVNVTRTFETAFFEVSLKGAPMQTLLDLQPFYPEVDLEYKIR